MISVTVELPWFATHTSPELSTAIAEAPFTRPVPDWYPTEGESVLVVDELLISERELLPEFATHTLKDLLLFALLPSIAKATGVLKPPAAELL